MDNEDKKPLFNALQESSEMFTQLMKEIEQEQEEFWNGLTEQQRLMAFCSVVRRIHQAEFVEKTSYRGTLYGVFDFGMESYVQAQDAGYLDIHNALVEYRRSED
jgi:hypothetical protein